MREAKINLGAIASSLSTSFLLSLLGAAVAAALIVGTAGWQLMEATHTRREVAEASDRVDRIAGSAQSLLQVVTQAESHQRGYLLLGREDYADAALNARPVARELLAELGRDARAEGLDLTTLNRIENLIESRFDVYERTIGLARAGRGEAALGLVRGGEGARIMAELHLVVRGLAAEVQAKRRAAVAARERARDLAIALQMLLITLVVAGFSVAAAVGVVGRYRAQQAAAAMGRANAEMARAHLEAEQANAAKSRFLAAASHDMRQPLHALSLYLASLGRRVDSADGQRILVNMEAAVRAMTRMFAALLDLARLEAGVLRPELVTFALGDLLANVAHQAAEVDRNRADRVTVMPTKLEIRSDPDLLEIIVRNLAVNAVKYAGAGRVLIGCRRAGDHVRIEVHDTGPGIPPERLQDLFGEFVRGDMTRSIEGLGLGLSIVDRLSQLLGHPIEVRSEVGRGSVFSVTVPRAAGLADQAPEGRATDVRGARILLVDDEPLVLDAMRIALEDAGATVVAAASGTEALAVAGRPFDLYVFDLALAGESGLDLLANIERRRGEAVRALIVTGSTSPEPLNALRRSGRTWITKPVSAVQLITAAADLLRGV